MPNKTTYDDIQITDKTNLDSSIIAASAKAVKTTYDIVQDSISDVYISDTGTDITYKKNNGITKNIVSAMSDSEAKTGTDTTMRTITAKVLNDKITSRLDVVAISKLSDLTAKGNGWYSITTTLAGVSSDWVIAKFGVLYTATSTKDPRIVLNSIAPTDTNEWYSPYGSWHV